MWWSSKDVLHVRTGKPTRRILKAVKPLCVKSIMKMRKADLQELWPQNYPETVWSPEPPKGSEQPALSMKFSSTGQELGAACL